MKKRILSVLLAFAMIFSLMPTALAAPTTYQVVTVDKTTVQAGETVNVKVTLPEGIQTAGSFTVVMNFDKEKFEAEQARKARAAQDIKRARSYQDLLAIQRKYGYKPGWAVIRARIRGYELR